MQILMTGSSGLVGSSLLVELRAARHSVVRLVRATPQPGSAQIQWDPTSEVIPPLPAEGIDAVIHLAGEGLTTRRWTPQQKARIRDSRVEGTRRLCQSLAHLAQPPRVLVSASAIGYYGDRGDEILNEGSAAGSGFLAQVCREWEEATAPAAQAGVRVVNLRISLVLSEKGGALAKMLPVFRMGLGGVMGSGRHYMSWIALDDLAGVIRHCLVRDDLQGPVIAAAPAPVTNRQFVETLARVLNRPSVLTMPAWAARMAFGEMANELLLASQRVDPARLKSSQYAFQYPELEGALRHLLVQ